MQRLRVKCWGWHRQSHSQQLCSPELIQATHTACFQNPQKDTDAVKQGKTASILADVARLPQKEAARARVVVTKEDGARVQAEGREGSSQAEEPKLSPVTTLEQGSLGALPLTQAGILVVPLVATANDTMLCGTFGYSCVDCR